VAYPPSLLVAAAIVAMVLSLFAYIRYEEWTYGADAGTFAQIIANTPHAMYDGFEGASHFRYHWSPILALLYPIVALTRNLLVLQLCQIALVVGAVFAFFALIEPHLGRRLATLLAFLALLYPATSALAFSEFHELAFAPLLIFLMLIGADRQRWTLYSLCAALAICVREDVAAIVACFGAVLAATGWIGGQRARAIAGTVTVGATIAAMGLYVFVILPHLGPWMPAHFYRYAFTTNPATIWTAFYQRGTYLLEIFVPLALLPLLTRWIWLCVPGLAIVLLANSALVWRMGMHYTALWLPWMLVAAAAGALYLRTRRGEKATARWVGVAIALSVVFLLAVNPMHLGHYLRPQYRDLASARRALGCVPLAASVATHDEWFSATALERPNATVAFDANVEYYVFADDYPNDAFQTQVLPAVRRSIGASYRQVCRFGKVAAYRRESGIR
jgi:uncharacterized membrane protein